MKVPVGYKVVFNNLPKLPGAVKQAVGKEVRRAGLDIEGQAKLNIQQSPASGRIYTLSNPSRKHQASAPGEPPATDLGDLVNSIAFKMVGELTGVVEVGSDHGAVQEFGGKNMAARPYLGPAVQQVLPSFEANIRRALSTAVNLGPGSVTRSSIVKREKN